MAEWTIEQLARFLHMTDAADCHDGFWWRSNGEEFKILINCNDLFWWACADCEEVTPESLDTLAQCFADVRPMNDAWSRTFRAHINDGQPKESVEPYVPTDYALLLFCARVRKMRPQGAYYGSFVPQLAALFDAAGPERVGDGDTARREYNGGFYAPNTEEPPWKRDRVVRSLRAKLMRERALRHETAAYEATGSSEHPHIGQLSRERYERRAESFFSRARRLRAEAERVEGGGR